MNFDITQIVIAIVGLISLVITTVAVPYYKSKTTREQRENIAFWAKLAVEAAEKIFKESGMGEKKKAFVEKFLNEHGIILDATQLDIVIESAVLEMQNAIAD